MLATPLPNALAGYALEFAEVDSLISPVIAVVLSNIPYLLLATVYQSLAFLSVLPAVVSTVEYPDFVSVSPKERLAFAPV